MGPFKDGWTIEEVEEVIRKDEPEDVLYVPIVVSLSIPDPDWSQEICINLSCHRHFQVRANAILGFSHIARVCGRLDETRVKSIVEAARTDKDRTVRSTACDVVEDIEHLLGWKFSK